MCAPHRIAPGPAAVLPAVRECHWFEPFRLFVLRGRGSIRCVAPEPQECSEDGCGRPVAFSTRTNPTWCDAHITAILRTGGLEPLEPFEGPKKWRLYRCLACGCEAHYRFEYVLDQNNIGIATCRACFWRKRAAEQRGLLEGYADLTPPSVAVAKGLAEQHGFEYLGPLNDPSLRDDPHRTRCLYCGRIAAQRLGDIGWGCQCQTNPRRAAQTSNVSGTAKPGTKHSKNLLKDSKLPVLAWWDHEVNDDAVWNTVTVKARREAAWKCPECGLRFSSRILDMTGYPSCPTCSVKRKAEWEAEYARLKVTPIADVPELAAAWADEANPRLITVAGGGMTLRRFRCPAGHHPRITPLSFLRGGCPSCRGNETRTARLEAVAADPAAHAMNREIASQWHLTKNGSLKLETISPGSRRIVWWKSWDCGHEWQATPAEREKGQRLRCPECRTILDSLAYHFTEIADEWSPDNPLTAWQVRPSGSTVFTPIWVCTNQSGHTWAATLSSRATGSGCPECRVAGKSKVELAHHESAVRIFGAASSGQAIADVAFTHGARWLVDITTVTSTGLKVAIEYDGAYWHADKAAIDTAKSLDLVAAGWAVIRLREHPLPSLSIDDPMYTELVVHSPSPDPDGVMRQVEQWTMAVRP